MTQTAFTILNACIHLEYKYDHLLFHSSFETVRFELQQQTESNYFNILLGNNIIGGLTNDNGRITGKINLSDVSSYNTCLLIQLSREEINDRLLLQPVRPKAKFDPQKTNFITNKEFKSCLI